MRHPDLEFSGANALKSRFDRLKHWAFEAQPPAAYDFAPRIRMVFGHELKGLGAQKNLSQGDVEKRTGPLRSYISRVENGQTVPSVDTRERLAQALEVPMYRLFTDEDRVKKPIMPAAIIPSRATNSKQERELRAFAKCFS
jgi:transcriptional regulator with XRE-family HTH domain